MSFAYLPLYTGDYLRDTRHLTPMRHGIFLMLLMHCWDQKGPLPLDEQECAGIANCRSSDEIEALRYVVGKFFIRMEDGHYNKRMQGEIERAESISSARSEAGRKGYEAKAKHLPSKRQASASTPTPAPILSPASTLEILAPTVLVAKGDAYRPPDCPFQELLDAYHANCPSLSRVRVNTNMRMKHARARWVQVCTDEKWGKAEALDWFAKFFRMVEKSDFLTARAAGNKRAWKADFEWLMTAGNFAKVVEEKYQGA